MGVASRGQKHELCSMGVAELGRAYRAREISPVEVTQAVLDRIDSLNPVLNAYLAVLADSALAAARAAEIQLGAGIDLGPLHGVPVSVKDLINVRGTRTTAGSKVLLDAPPDEEDAPVVLRLRAVGAILVGKTNLHEFAHGDPDPEGPFGNVQNPRKIGHQAGSSSSGSAAAVAAGMGVLSLGTDTGGSIRHPSSVCGLVGLKPTHGLVPIRGVIPLSVHQDHVGPIGRSVGDVAACLQAIAGHDPADPYSALQPIGPYTTAVGREVAGLRVGLPTNQIYRFGLPAALQLVERTRSVLVELGLRPVPITLPRAEETNDRSTTIISVDRQVYHERYRERVHLYGRDFSKRVAQTSGTTAQQYAEAREAQTEIRRQWIELFDQLDLLLLPANVAGAPPHGEDTIEVDGEHHPVSMVCSRFSRAANLTGLPAMVVPVGETPDGLPIGVQLIGPPFGEARLFAVGHALVRALGNLPEKWGIEPRRGTSSGGLGGSQVE